MKRPELPRNRSIKRIYLYIYNIFSKPFLPVLKYSYIAFLPIILITRLIASIYLVARNEYLKSHLSHCGKGVHLNGHISIRNPRNLSLGNNVHINNNALINCYAPVSIGDHTHISYNFTLYSGNHNYSGKRLPYDEDIIQKPVNIGNNVWVGVNVSIIPGVSIGDGAIIGMGTTVTSDVPPLAIVGCAPMRILKYRDGDDYENLKQNAKYGGVAGFEYLE